MRKTSGTRLPVFLKCTRQIFLCCLRLYSNFYKENREPGNEANVHTHIHSGFSVKKPVTTRRAVRRRKRGKREDVTYCPESSDGSSGSEEEWSPWREKQEEIKRPRRRGEIVCLSSD